MQLSADFNSKSLKSNITISGAFLQFYQPHILKFTHLQEYFLGSGHFPLFKKGFVQYLVRNL